MPQSGSKVEVVYDTIDGLGKQVAPAVPASTVAKTNPFSFACMVRVKGGTVTVVSVAGVQYAAGSNVLVYVDVDEAITITYSAAPTWDWFGVPGK
jgi:hypothetical protein